jgi:hypothetical protein
MTNTALDHMTTPSPLDRMEPDFRKMYDQLLEKGLIKKPWTEADTKLPLRARAARNVEFMDEMIGILKKMVSP